VLVADVQHSGEVAHWPMFAAAVIERSPVRAVFALPLQWGRSTCPVGDRSGRRRRPGIGDADLPGHRAR
jgi:hypothetical protein